MRESPQVEQMRSAEEHNCGISLRALGATSEMADDCAQLYDALPKLLTAANAANGSARSPSELPSEHISYL